MFPILSKRALNEAATVYEFRIRAPLAAAHCRAGQFVIIQLDEQGERIPLTVAACGRRQAARPHSKTTHSLHSPQPRSLSRGETEHAVPPPA